MKNRSPFTICAPLAVFVAACLFSIPSFVLAAVWMTLGVMTLGHRTLESFPSAGIPRAWRHGYRAAFVWFYHLAWWPWYMRAPIRQIAGRIGMTRRREASSTAQRPDAPDSHHPSTHDRE